MIAASVIGSLWVYTTWTSGLAWNIACDTGIAFSRSQSAFWLAMISAVRVVGEPLTEPVAALLRRRRALQPADLDHGARIVSLVGAVLGGVGPGLLADLHVVGADPHRELVALDLAVEDDHRHALGARLGDDVGQRRRLVRRDDQQVDALGEEVLDVGDLLGVVLGGVGEDDLQLRVGRGGGGDLVVHRLAPRLALVRLRHADQVAVLGLDAALGDTGRRRPAAGRCPVRSSPATPPATPTASTGATAIAKSRALEVVLIVGSPCVDG